ncbi:hypothetical protein [Neptunicella sp. SCSIO 80796]
MPVLLVPAIAAALGFGGGLWASSAVSKLTTLAAIGGAGYLIYINTKGD